MLIACPQCSATYEVPVERVPAGREVRCARCITLWTPVPVPVVQAVPASVPDIRPEPAYERAVAFAPEPLPVAEAAAPVVVVAAAGTVQAAPARLRWGLGLAWCLTVVMVGGLAWFGVMRRAEVMQAWPPSERAYAAVGLVPRR